MEQQMMQMMQMMFMQQGMQNQQNSLFQSLSRPAMFAGVQQQPSQMFDFGAMGGSQMGQLGGALLQGIMPQLMGPNYMPGQFTPTQNWFDHRYSTQYFAQQRAAMARASEADTETYFRMTRGMARTMGINWAEGSEQEKAARRFAGDLTGLANFIGPMMPDSLDAASGIRGSASIMAKSMFDAGRYGFDPATGRLGMSGESVGAMSRDIFNTLYAGNADISQMRGIGAGRAGQMYDELVRRGYGAPALIGRDEITRQMKKDIGSSFPVSGINIPGIGDLQASLNKQIDQMDPQAFDAASRSFNADKAAKTIKGMVGAVSAMRDIFGDMGRPNAPMVELINGLQALTQGGMSAMRPAELEMSVRNTYAMAKYTGLGLEGMLGFAGTASNALAGLGTSRGLAPKIAQDSAAWAFGFGLTGQPTGIGALDKERASQLDLQSRASAATSPQAIRLASLMRFGTELAGANPNGGFIDKSEAAQIFEAVNLGKTTYGPDNKSIFMAASDMQRILVAGGVDSTAAQMSLFRSAAAAAADVDRFGTGKLAREGQGRLDINPTLARSYMQSAGVTLGDRNRGDLSREIGQALADEVQALYETEPDIFSNDRSKDRNKALVARLKGRLDPTLLAGMTDAQLENLVSNAYIAGDEDILNPNSRLRHLEGTKGALQLNSKRTLELQRKTAVEVASIAELQKSMSSLGQGTLLRRVSDMLQDVNPDGKSIQDMLFESIGGIKSKDIAGQLGGLFLQINDLATEYEKADEPRRKEIRATMERLAPQATSLMGGDDSRLSQEAKNIIKNRGGESGITGQTRALVNDTMRALTSLAPNMPGYDPSAFKPYEVGKEEAKSNKPIEMFGTFELKGLYEVIVKAVSKLLKKGSMDPRSPDPDSGE